MARRAHQPDLASKRTKAPQRIRMMEIVHAKGLAEGRAQKTAEAAPAKRRTRP